MNKEELENELNRSKTEKEKKKEEKLKRKQEKKEKKQNKKKKKISLIIFMTIFAVIFGSVGFVGGYFVYQIIKPEQTFSSDFIDINALKERGEKAGNDLLKEFKDDKYNIVNYAMYKFGSMKNSLMLSANTVDNFSGAQRVTSATMCLDGNTFNQNISSTDPGAIVEIKTAVRFYDNKEGYVVGYEMNEPSQWVDGLKPTKEYTYDEYITTYGKLHKPYYVMNAEGGFLSADVSVEGDDMIATSIYQITQNSVKSCEVTESADGYVFDIELYSAYACFYYSSQIKKNGGLSKNPKFNETLSTRFVLDKDFNLIYSNSAEVYKVTMGLEVECSATATINYYATNDDQLIVNDQIIEIPEIGESFDLKINEQGEFI